MRVVVTGSREWKHLSLMSNVLHDTLQRGDVLIHGGARGADRAAGAMARTMGLEVIEVPADWRAYGRRAGYLRNIQMLDEHRPDLVLAFCLDQSRGTMHTVEEAMKCHIPVNLYSRWSEDRDRDTG